MRAGTYKIAGWFRKPSDVSKKRWVFRKTSGIPINANAIPVTARRDPTAGADFYIFLIYETACKTFVPATGRCGHRPLRTTQILTENMNRLQNRNRFLRAGNARPYAEIVFFCKMPRGMFVPTRDDVGIVPYGRSEFC